MPFSSRKSDDCDDQKLSRNLKNFEKNEISKNSQAIIFSKY